MPWVCNSTDGPKTRSGGKTFRLSPFPQVVYLSNELGGFRIQQMLQNPLQIDFAAPCPNCKHLLPPLREIADQYFESGNVECKTCGAKVDAWKETLSLAREQILGFVGLASLGARVSVFSLQLAPGESKKVDFSTCGVPKEATILSVNYTPQDGDCFPLEVHGNSPQRRILGTERTLYGRPLDSGRRGEPINILVTWVHSDDSSEGWLYLVDAFEAVATGRFSQVVVPAHAAVEISLTSLISSALLKYVSKQNIRRFLEDLPYSHALNIILPLICIPSGIPPLAEPIRGELNRLRKLRNKVVHERISPSSVSDAQAGELLCAAVFGFEYVRFVRSLILQKNRGQTGRFPSL